MTALTDAQRRTLHEGAQKAMGKKPADILLASLPPQGWDDLATKADVTLQTLRDTRSARTSSSPR